MSPLATMINTAGTQTSNFLGQSVQRLFDTKGSMFDSSLTRDQANTRTRQMMDSVDPTGSVGSVEKAAPVASSVVSYIAKNGEKLFTKLAPHELNILKNEVKYIPQAAKGVSQIHLDPLNTRLHEVAREVPRDQFINGHPQAAQVFKNTLQQPRTLLGQFHFK